MARGKVKIDLNLNIDKKYALLIFILVLLHIIFYGSYDNKVVYKEKLNKKVEDLRARYITQMAELMNMNLESQVKRELNSRNIKLIKDGLPKKIYVEPVKNK